MERNLIGSRSLTQDSESGNPLRDDGATPRGASSLGGESMEIMGVLNAVAGLGDVMAGLEAAFNSVIDYARNLELENAVLMQQQKDNLGDFGVFQWVYDGVHRVVHVTGSKPSKDLTPLLFGWEILRGCEDHDPPQFKCYDVRKISDMYMRMPARGMVA